MPTPHSAQLLPVIVAAVVIAFVLGLLTARLHLSPLVGYLLAGIAIGPFTLGFVSDIGLAQQLAELGVILLMFGVGLHLSVADLAAVRPIAIWGALAQMVVSVPAGVGLALAWGWTATAGVLLGLGLFVASGAVLRRILAEHHTLDGHNGRLAIGWLIVQVLVIVLVLVLLPTFAGGGGAAGGFSDLGAELAVTIVAKVALFGLLVVVGGKQVVPKLLELVARDGSRELFILSLLATALCVAYGLAELFGVSFALGAFFAGVVLNESDSNRQAAADSLLCGACEILFFVSVGMLFDPAVLLREPVRVAAVLLVILIVKSLAAMPVILLGGQPLGTTLRVSAALAQIGEFSFILAGLSVNQGMLPPEGNDLILAGVLLSIAANPIAFDLAGRLAQRLKRNPRSWRG